MTTTTHDGDKLVRAYLSLRDKRAELKREFESEDKKLIEDMAVIEKMLASIVESSGATSARFEHGTIIRQVKTKYSASDWAEFNEWVLTNQRLDMFQKRLSSAALDEFIADNNAVPPGVALSSEYVITVRRN